jgi:hypothetical protein
MYRARRLAPFCEIALPLTWAMSIIEADGKQ